MFIPSYDGIPFKLPFPMPSQFAVLRIDPVAMVEPLRDPQAMSEARAMKPKKYLMYLAWPTDLPTPTSLWCRYGTWPVASTLRPADPKNGLAEDMVMPMFPNTRYLKDRPALTPQPPFPFSNCFFWAFSSILLRVKVRKEGYDDSRAIKLTIKDHCNLLSCFDSDNSRMMEIATEYQAAHPESTVVSPEAGSSMIEVVQGSHSSIRSPSSSDESLPSPSISDSEEESVRTELEPPFESPDDYSVHSTSSSDDLRGYNLFGWDPDPNVFFLPLVDLWFELEDHLTEGSIPSPLEFYEEEAAIKSIIERSLERQKRAGRPVNLYSCLVPAATDDHMDLVQKEDDTSPVASMAASGVQRDAASTGASAFQDSHVTATPQHALPPSHDEPPDPQRWPTASPETTEPNKVGKRKQLQDLEHSDRPLKKRVLYWPISAIVRLFNRNMRNKRSQTWRAPAGVKA